MEPLIKLENIVFHYDADKPIINGLDLTVKQQDKIGLTGPNGSGKTTLFHLMVGLLTPISGSINIFNEPRTREKDFYEVRTKMGLLFQDPDNQLFCATVAEDIAFGPFNLGKTRDEVSEIVTDTLEKLGLEKLEHRITYKLSTGEKRLVSLAAVLAMNPEVLLLDEPTAGLDTATREKLIEIIIGLDKTKIIISHDEDFLNQVTTHKLILKDGGIISEQ